MAVCLVSFYRRVYWQHEVVNAPNTTTFKNRLDRHWKKYQYTLDSIPTTLATFSTEYEEDRNETSIWQAVYLFKDVNIILYVVLT